MRLGESQGEQAQCVTVSRALWEEDGAGGIDGGREVKKESGSTGGGKEREKQRQEIAGKVCPCRIKTRSELAPVTHCACAILILSFAA